MLCLHRVVRRRRCRCVCGVRVLVYLGAVLLCVGLGVSFIVPPPLGTGGNTGSWRSSAGRERGQSHSVSLTSNPDSHNYKYQSLSQDIKSQREKPARHLPLSVSQGDILPPPRLLPQDSQGPDPLQSVTPTVRYQDSRRGSGGTGYHKTHRGRSRNKGNMADTEGRTADFNGKWKLVKSENFEEFLAANGANWFMRKMASKASPSVEITQDGDKFCVTTVTPVRTQVDNFTVGTPYDHEAMGGVKMKVTPSWDGEALVLENVPQEAGKGKPFTIQREIVDGQLVLTMKIDNVVCKRWFDKV